MVEPQKAGEFPHKHTEVILEHLERTLSPAKKAEADPEPCHHGPEPPSAISPSQKQESSEKTVRDYFSDSVAGDSHRINPLIEFGEPLKAALEVFDVDVAFSVRAADLPPGNWQELVVEIKRR